MCMYISIDWKECVGILGTHHDRNGIEYGIGIAMVSAGRE